ncbi:MAG: methionine--tRNA ligase [Lentisphaerae bacterium RIFOXYB12_FULL_65_16]|nr:MAG: methionine--tRNA ligase [Lentisphaerae bacterium RIFOXYA12_64_32]OGV85083.1 MAG: methionine--tRNA ligase [Lentisphaerae bacterium RIFOXYB12_FULL_65_16]
MSNGPCFLKDRARPSFPKRAVVTGGMPYGNKDLHFGHIGGVFVQADVFARFLRDRLGPENVIFVSGTDCYGSPIVEDHRKQVAAGDVTGSLDAFVRRNHARQRETLNAYHINLNLFAASALDRQGEIHREMGESLLRSLHANGHLENRVTRQFYDAKLGVFLNGRQVLGRCPIQGCRSDKAYADECSLGHQYEPKELITPVSQLTGEKPEMRDVHNWYIRLPAFRNILEPWLRALTASESLRQQTVGAIMLEHFEPPTIYVTKDQDEALTAMAAKLPRHQRHDGDGGSLRLVFERLEDMEEAKTILGQQGLRYRSGKTLVPFRLTGNLEWGLPVPELDGLGGLTFWVWPESLWAPISFCAAYLEQQGRNKDEWKEWWCSPDAQVYQFIGEDNVFFYGLPQAAIFLGTQGPNPVVDPPAGQMRLTQLIANRHLLFLDKKASSSSAIKPPMAADLLNYYTPDQLRIHFFSLALGKRSVSFRPKPLNAHANPKEADPVLKEGNLLSNAFNRAVRSCFYTAQKFYDARIPVGEVAPDVLETCEKAVLDVEAAMAACDFPQVVVLLDEFVRAINSRWTKSDPYKDTCDPVARRQTLIDAFHMVRVATVLLHPIAPEGTERVRDYLQVGPEFWAWARLFEPIYVFMADPAAHQLRVLEPRVDFFGKHPSQVVNA